MWKRRTEKHRGRFAVRRSAIAFDLTELNFHFALCARMTFRVRRGRHLQHNQVPAEAVKFRM